MIDKYFDMCFPIKIKFITLKRLSKPWITTALHNSIKTKHDLYRLVRQNNFDLNTYKRYCNILNGLLKTSKVSCYNQQFDDSKRDLKRTWSIINSAIKPEKRSSFILKLNHNNETITDTTKIAEALNIHFSGIGTKLKNALPKRNEDNYRKHLPAALPNSIYLFPSTPSEVVNIIKEMKNIKRNMNSLLTKILKANSLSLSILIYSTFNNIITQSHDP